MAASAVKRLFGAGPGNRIEQKPIADPPAVCGAVPCHGVTHAGHALLQSVAGPPAAEPEERPTSPVPIVGAPCANAAAVPEQLAGPEEALAPASITREELELPNQNERRRGAFAFVLHDVFTLAECAAMIAASEARGYDQALVNTGHSQILDTSYRNSMRNIWDTPETAAETHTRIAPHLPNEAEPQRFGYVTAPELLKCDGINERLRFLRYDPGDFFAAHKDGCYQRPDRSAQSYLTLMLYLNSGGGVDYAGGETSFVSQSGGQPDVALVPRAGDVLIFTHPVLHQGNEVTGGRKYAVRTDVMYSSGEPENE